MITNGITFPIATNVFLTKIAANGSAVLDSAVFGGSRIDIGNGVAVDSAGDAFVVGEESSTNFPAMNAPGSLSTNSSGLSLTNSGGYDVFVAAFPVNWTNMYYNVCIGGNQDDLGNGIVLDSSTNVFITGSANSTNYPTQGAGRYWFNGTNVINGTNFINGAAFTGTNDAFLTEIALGAFPVGPQITNGPASQTNNVGSTATFTVLASGTPPLMYQWLFNGSNLVNGVNISGATSNTLTISGLVTTNTGTYTVVITNNWGMASTNATLVVPQSPLIILPLTNQSTGVGAPVTFVVTAFGQPPLHYQWLTNGINLVNGGNITGVTNSQLIITNVQVYQAATYEVLVTNRFGSASSSAILTVSQAPIIVTPLTNQTVGIGSTVTFAITAYGEPPLSYQWQSNGVALANEAEFSGVTNSILTISNAQVSDSATNYEIVVTNSFGMASNGASLTVLPAPMFTSVTLIGSNLASGLSYSGVGGSNSGSFSIYISTNLLVPVTNWPFITSLNFDSQGGFGFTFDVASYFQQTNSAHPQTNVFQLTNPPPQLYLLIKQP
jgi:hypothetical protein